MKKKIILICLIFCAKKINGAIDQLVNNANEDYFVKLTWIDSNKCPTTDLDVMPNALITKGLGQWRCYLGTVDIYKPEDKNNLQDPNVRPLLTLNKRNNLSCNSLNIYKIKVDGNELLLASCSQNISDTLKTVKTFKDVDKLDSSNKFQVAGTTLLELEDLYKKGVLPIK